MTTPKETIHHHEIEAANLALEAYQLRERLEEIGARMRELRVIIKTANLFSEAPQPGGSSKE